LRRRAVGPDRFPGERVGLEVGDAGGVEGVWIGDPSLDRDAMNRVLPSPAFVSLTGGEK